MRSVSTIIGCSLLLVLMSCGGGNSPGATSEQPENKVVPFSLEEVQRRNFNYFWELAHDKNFQIPDRYPTRTFSSIAATGFGLMTLTLFLRAATKIRLLQSRIESSSGYTGR